MLVEGGNVKLYANGRGGVREAQFVSLSMHTCVFFPAPRGLCNSDNQNKNITLVILNGTEI